MFIVQATGLQCNPVRTCNNNLKQSYLCHVCQGTKTTKATLVATSIFCTTNFANVNNPLNLSSYEIRKCFNIKSLIIENYKCFILNEYLLRYFVNSLTRVLVETMTRLCEL